MRILLAQNSLYYPAHGGGDKSNRLLLEALASRGHACAVVARIGVFGDAGRESYLAELAARGVEAQAAPDGIVHFSRAGVEVHVATAANLRAAFVSRMQAFSPDAILASTDDPAQLLLDPALRHPTASVVYLARATLALPFGPDCAFPSEAKTARLRAADRLVGVSQYVADYISRYSGIPAVHVPISLMEPGAVPALGRFENQFVTLVNPCAVKGLAIFLALADAFPEVAFAAVPTWGTNQQDRAALAARGNIRLLDPVDEIGQLLARTRVLLAPSLWAEARSRIVLEAMLRGVPVMAANVGGIPEAKMGVPYLLPVNPITRYQTRLDEQMVPVAEVPPQDAGPWREALGRLLSDRPHYEEIARASRVAALEYCSHLTAEPFERLLLETGGAGESPARREPFPAAELAQSLRPSPPSPADLSPEKRRLLALRLRKQAPPAAWFPAEPSRAPRSPGQEAVRRLFWFPHAGGGATPALSFALDRTLICPVRLPGRESRLAEAPFESMGPLVEALASAIESYLDRPFAFFGHSMGAGVSFELARMLRRRGLPLPDVLIASAARAPQLRRGPLAPDITTDALLNDLRRLGGIPAELLESPELMRSLLPAIEADARLYRRYIYTEGGPLPCPIRAYGGVDDPNLQREHLEAWSEQTTAGFALRLFPGGHFYYQTCGAEFRAALEEDLK
jgi:surfactin synthase thioesterase subunit/glycosyltransferase involved in cell wall biosynthesis